MSYQFLPWAKAGTGSVVAAEETLSDTAPARIRVPVTLRINNRHDASVRLRLFGPADITGIDHRQIVRVEPRPFTSDFEPNYFPAVELRRADFPWMFTPATGDARGRLRPWLCLVAVRMQEGVRIGTNRGSPLPVLAIGAPAQPSAELPDLAESWAWAHTQIIGQEGVLQIAELLEEESPRAISRLLCPIKLRPNTRYYGCLVPAFEVGRRVGLGLDPGTEDNLAPAWRFNADSPLPLELPVYFHWEFATGAGGDFESLVRRLQGRPVPPGVGVRELEIAGLGFGLPDLGTVNFEGVLRPPGTDDKMPDPEKLTQFKHALRSLLNTSIASGDAEPVVGPPVYGTYQAAVRQAPAPAAAPVWLGDLNLDPRHRVAAGLGTLVVQDQQEQLMAAAWEQLSGVKATMQARRQKELAQEAGRKVLVKHLATLSETQLLEVTSPVHARILFSLPAAGLRSAAATAAATPAVSTLESQLRRSHLPRGATSTAFRRVLRASGPVMRRLAQSIAAAPAAPVNNRLVQRLVAGPSTIVPIPLVRGVATTAQIDQQLEELRRRIAAGSVTGAALAEAQRFLAAGDSLQAYLEKTLPPGVPALPPAPPSLAEIRQVVLARLDPNQTIGVRLQMKQPASVLPPTAKATVEDATDDSLLSVVPHPRFPQPMYEALRDVSQKFLLPGAEKIPPDTVTLLRTNPQFVESFLAGLNHEMSRELLWREYPTDQRGTYFTRFWDPGGALLSGPQDQIAPIHLWKADAALGKTFLGDGFDGWLVLLIRGEILRRYPGTVIYAVKADTLNKPAAEELYPVFRGSLDPDIVFLGFNLTEAAARGGQGLPGYYFVLQEQPAEPRFGLDIPDQFGADPLVLATWKDLTWGHIAADADAFSRLTHLPLGGRLEGRRLENAEWGFNSAHMARITLQPRMRVAIHASELLPASAQAQTTT
jgi:hypothetical protein